MAGSPSAAVRRTLRRLMVKFQDLAERYPNVNSMLVEAPMSRRPELVGTEPRATVDDERRDTWRIYEEGPPERCFYYYGSREAIREYQKLAEPAARCLATWPEAARRVGLESGPERHNYRSQTWTLALHRIAGSRSMETDIVVERSTPCFDDRATASDDPDGPLLAPDDWRQPWHGIDIPSDCFMSQMYHDSLFANSVSLIDYLLSLPEEAPVADEGALAPERDPSDFVRIAMELAREGRPIRAALVRYMAHRDSAPFEDIARNVHGDKAATEDAIRGNIHRTNQDLKALAARFWFKSGGGMVHKELHDRGASRPRNGEITDK